MTYLHFGGLESCPTATEQEFSLVSTFEEGTTKLNTPQVSTVLLYSLLVRRKLCMQNSSSRLPLLTWRTLHPALPASVENVRGWLRPRTHHHHKEAMQVTTIPYIHGHSLLTESEEEKSRCLTRAAPSLNNRSMS